MNLPSENSKTAWKGSTILKERPELTLSTFFLQPFVGQIPDIDKFFRRHSSQTIIHIKRKCGIHDANENRITEEEKLTTVHTSSYGNGVH